MACGKSGIFHNDIAAETANHRSTASGLKSRLPVIRAAMSVRHSDDPHYFRRFDVDDDEREAAKDEFADALSI